jgi:phosphoribosylformylglycinamidine cyclo-ligase
MNKKQSGVDINLGNDCSKIAFNWAKKTFENRETGQGNPIPTVDGGFSTLMDFGGVKIGMSSDGVGTKIELAERTGIYNTLGYDLIAMAADDLAANGIETVNLSNILDVDFLDANIVNDLMSGLHEAANFSRITITGGEIAELGSRIGGYGDGMHFNWGATAIGILKPEIEIIDGGLIQPGDIVVSLKSRGFRSNGFSLIRKMMQEKFGTEWHREKYDEQKSWGEALLTPSLIYTPLIADLIKEKYIPNGIVHITGGGIADNFSRVLKKNQLGARLTDIFEPLPVMKKIQKLGDVKEEQAYQLWNMGNGMLLVFRPEQADSAIEFIKNEGYKAQTCGKIISEPLIITTTKGMLPEQLEFRY